MTQVRTRFAPSPTGFMHIGGMRTALFNWLWARHNNGAFILRIDDTDKQRNLDEALEPILQAFRWLGLAWDEGPEVGGDYGPYFQSQRSELYEAAGKQLLESKAAYYDFDTPEQTKADRTADEKEKKIYLTRRRSLELSEEEIQQFLEEGRPHVVRFFIPRDQKVNICDAIRGDVEWHCALMNDPVIMRSDGSPLYNFATVVDDAQLEITHVIRAEEHLTNTSIQVLIFQALGYELPVFAHIPYVAAPGTKEKLSKRKLDKYRKNPQFKGMFEAADRVFSQIGLEDQEGLDPVMVEYYEKIGYLPAGVLNGLVRLGWSLDDKTEIFSLEDAIQNFSLDRVIKSPAGFDPDKLISYQSHWMNELTTEEKVTGCLPYLLKANLISEKDEQQRLFVAQLIIALEDRVKLFSDILEYDEFFRSDNEMQYDKKALKKRINKEGVADRLKKFQAILTETEDFSADNLETQLKSFVEEEEIQLGEIIHALRVAVTGKPKGTGMFVTLELLGRERCINRINRTLSLITDN